MRSWSPVERSIYRLSILSVHQEDFDREHPRVVVMLAGQAATWPDLAAMGVAFPQPRRR